MATRMSFWKRAWPIMIDCLDRIEMKFFSFETSNFFRTNKHFCWRTISRIQNWCIPMNINIENIFWKIMKCSTGHFLIRVRRTIQNNRCISLPHPRYRHVGPSSVNPCSFWRFWIFSNVINPIKANFSNCSNKFPKLCRPKKNNFWYSMGIWRRRQWRLFSRNLLFVWSLKLIMAPGVNFRKIESGT